MRTEARAMAAMLFLWALLALPGCGERIAGEETCVTENPSTQPGAETPDIAVMENREGELVFSISIDDFIDSYNGFSQNGDLPPSFQWRSKTYASAVHSRHETTLYNYTADEAVWTLPTITVYVPANGDYVQEITLDFDEHSYSPEAYDQFEEMCLYTLKVFFPGLSDERIAALCREAIRLGNQNVFSHEEWYGSDPVPCALFHKNGVGVYPYFAIGDWGHLCVIPVTEETINAFQEKGVDIYEME